MNQTLQELFANPAEAVAIVPTIANFVLCMLMAFVVRSFYIHRSVSLSGKQHIGSILPILSGVIFLVIVIVKSSLALSLGLVGALSIVRFRTPIKDPEELVYLFIAIALGLGYGAGQTAITTILVTLLLLVIYWRLSNRSVSGTKEYNLVIDWQSENVTAEKIVSLVNTQTDGTEIVKYSDDNGSQTLVLRIDVTEFSRVDSLAKKLQSETQELSLQFFESSALW